MPRFVPILLVLLLTALLLACGSSDNGQPPLVQGEFVVRFDPIEGGCWSLVASDNTVYHPIALTLDEEYRIDGLRVSASLRLSPQTVTVCPGFPAEIVEIAPVP